MNIIRPILNALPVGAFFFALWYLWGLETPLNVRIVHYDSCLLSFALLGAVFVARSIIWRLLLKRYQVYVGLYSAFVSEAVTTLMKYIPGKIWGVIGKADLIAQHGHSLQRCSMVAFFLQFLMILTGLFVGITGILVFDYVALAPIFAYGFLFLFLCSMLLFVKELSLPATIFRWIPALQRRFAQKRIPPVIDIMLYCVAQWILLGTAYMCFMESMGFSVGPKPILLQPLANNIGIVSVFAPAGLGVREGMTVTYLTLAEISFEQAMAIAVACRFWFLVVEIVVYLAGLTMKKRLS